MLPWCSNPGQVRALDLGEMTIDAFSSQLTTHNIYCPPASFLPRGVRFLDSHLFLERKTEVVSENGPSRSSNYFYLPPDWTANNQQTTNISVCTTTHQQNSNLCFDWNDVVYEHRYDNTYMSIDQQQQQQQSMYQPTVCNTSVLYYISRGVLSG